MNVRSLLLAFATAGATAACDLITGHELVAPPPSKGVVDLVVPESAFADGASLTPIAVTVDTTLPATLRTVTVSTSAGSLTPDGKQTTLAGLIPDDSGHVYVYLQAPRDATRAQITAFAGVGPARLRTIRYDRAPAETVVVIPDSITISDSVGHFTRVEVRLLRAVGWPSPHAMVECYGDTSGPDQCDHFSPPTPSDSSGVVVMVFSPATTPSDTMPHGTFTIRVRLKTHPAVRGTASIVVW